MATETQSDIIIIRPDLRLRYNGKASRISLLIALPILSYVLIDFARLGLVLSTISISTALVILAGSYAWVRWAHKIILGPDYVRVKWGPWSKTFRPDPEIASVVVTQMYSGLFGPVDPQTGWLFLRQEKTRASISSVNTADRALILQKLGNPTPFQTVTVPFRGLLDKPTGKFAAALPMWLRRPVLFGLSIFGVIVIAATMYAIYAVRQGNDAYRQAATPRLQKVAARYVAPEWSPTSDVKITWTDKTDHSGLSYTRSFAVPYTTDQEFITAWGKLTGDHNANDQPTCETDSAHYENCRGWTHTYVDGKYQSITASYLYKPASNGDAAYGPDLDLTIDESR